jgi:hypothetical protein
MLGGRPLSRAFVKSFRETADMVDLLVSLDVLIRDRTGSRYGKPYFPMNNVNRLHGQEGGNQGEGRGLMFGV